MENVAHTLCGFAVADSAFSDRLGRKTAWWTAAVASNVPDIDILTLPFVGRDYYLEWHRGTTHSLLACVLVPPLIALVASRMSGRDFRPLWLLAFACYAAHLALDVPTVWGTMLLMPFSDARFGVPWVFIVDLFFIAILSMPFWLRSFVDVSGPALPRFALGVLAVYIAMCGGLHEAAISDVHAAAERRGIEAKTASAWPAPFLPILWNGIVTDDQHMYQAGVRVVGGYDTELVNIGALNATDPAVRAVLASPEGRRFVDWWAGEPLPIVRCSGKNRQVIITDMKFRSPWMGLLPDALRGTGFSLVFHLEPADSKDTYRIVRRHWLMPLDGDDGLPADACPIQPVRKKRASRDGDDQRATTGKATTGGAAPLSGGRQ